MILDRTVDFSESEIDFSNAPGGRRSSITDEGPVRKRPGGTGTLGQRPGLGIP
jgi:hypothetical protein